MTTKMNDIYINVLLADASYVDLSTNINSRLALRLTQPLADFITQNFEACVGLTRVQCAV